MEYIYAALILHTTGKEITEDGIINIVKAAGIEPDEVRAKALVSALDGVDIEEAISKAAVSAPVAQAAAPEAKAETEAPSEVKEEEKEKEEDKEEAEESGMAGLGALFG